MDDNYFYLFSFIYKMNASFLRRHKQFLINITSASGLLALGDFCAQIFYEKKKSLDDKRLCILFILFDFFLIILILVAACVTGTAMGVEGHVWYTFLDRIIAQPTWRNVFKKVLLDQTVAAPTYTTTYIIGKIRFFKDFEYVIFDKGTSILEGKTSLGELKSDTKANFLPLYIADCLVFIPVQIINFRYISASYRVPFMFFIAFIFNAFISAYKHTHEK